MAEQRCVECGAPMEESQTSCPACGAERSPDADVTAAFSPVSEAAEAAATVSAVTIGRGPALTVSKGPDVGERFALTADVVTIGRDPASDIFLNDITVSRRHARIERAGAGFTLNDVGSLNGTYVNGQRIESYALAASDEIQIGKFRLVFST